MSTGGTADQTGLSGQDVAVQLEFLRHAAAGLDVADPVPARLAQVARWVEPPDFASSWLTAAAGLDRAVSDVDAECGAVDAAWQGAGAEAFLARLSGIRRRGAAVADEVRALGEALQDVAAELNRLGAAARRLIAEATEDVYLALHDPQAGPEPARDRLDDLRRTAAERTGAADRALASFAACCAELAPVAGGSPGAAPRGSARPAAPGCAAPRGGEPGADPASPERESGAAATTASAADEDAEDDGGGSAAAASGAAAGGLAGGVVPMAGMAAGLARKRDRRRSNASRFKSDPAELFPAPQPQAPPAFGERRKPEQPG